MKKRMKIRGINTILALAFLLLCFPGIALAAPDVYGYNAEANLFHGTLENWDNFIFNRSSVPYDFEAFDTIFLLRKWDKNFDNGMFKGDPFVNGSWQQAHFYMFPSDQPGWVWNWKFKMVYSSNPVPGAAGIDEMPDFYIIQDKQWYTDPQGNEYIIYSNQSVSPALGAGFYK